MPFIVFAAVGAVVVFLGTAIGSAGWQIGLAATEKHRTKGWWRVYDPYYLIPASSSPSPAPADGGLPAYGSASPQEHERIAFGRENAVTDFTRFGDELRFKHLAHAQAYAARFGCKAPVQA